MLKLILGTGVTLALSTTLFGQTPSQAPSGNLHRTVAPVQGVYSMDTGFALATHSARSGPATIFDNTDGITYYFSTLTDSEEWIDSIAFEDTFEGSDDEQINGLAFNYCSQLADPVGDAITVCVRFYNDNPGFMEPTGWTDLAAGTIQNAACAYEIAGLPGDTSLTGASCWAVAIDLMCGFECSVPQELTPGGVTEWNGVGWMYKDGFGGGLTGPFLGSTVGPGGPGTANPGYGSRDLFELMDLAIVGSEWQGTFFFGGAPKAQATFDLVLFGDDIFNTRVVNADNPTANDNLCLVTDTEFVAGNDVTFDITQGLIGGDYYLLVSTGLSGTQPLVGSVGSECTLMLDLPLYNPAAGGVIPMSGSTLSTGALPPGLPGLYAQAICLPSGAPLAPGNVVGCSNALCFD